MKKYAICTAEEKIIINNKLNIYVNNANILNNNNQNYSFCRLKFFVKKYRHCNYVFIKQELSLKANQLLPIISNNIC